MEFPKACYVILHISLGPTESQEASSDHLVARDDERFQLRDDIWIERLDEGLLKIYSKRASLPTTGSTRVFWIGICTRLSCRFLTDKQRATKGWIFFTR